MDTHKLASGITLILLSILMWFSIIKFSNSLFFSSSVINYEKRFVEVLVVVDEETDNKMENVEETTAEIFGLANTVLDAVNIELVVSDILVEKKNYHRDGGKFPFITCWQIKP